MQLITKISMKNKMITLMICYIKVSYLKYNTVKEIYEIKEI